MTRNVGPEETPLHTVSALDHYEHCIAEGNDPCEDGPVMQRYMARWDGPLFFDMLGNLTGKAVLEVGVGTGRLARQVLQRGCLRFIGIDLSPATIQRARRNLAGFPNVDLRVADIETMALPLVVDVAYSVLTFMHIADKERALAAMVNALAPDGAVVLSIAHVTPRLDFGNRTVTLYPAPPTAYAAWLSDLGCSVTQASPLIDGWVGPDGQRSETYGEPIATLIKAVKVERRDPPVLCGATRPIRPVGTPDRHRRGQGDG